MELLVRYHRKGGFFDAECPALPEFVAGDPDLDVLRAMVREAVSHLISDEVTIVEVLDGVPLVAAAR